MKKACGISMRTSDVQEVAVVQGLQAEVAELQVALGVDGLASGPGRTGQLGSSSSASMPLAMNCGK
jgi:ABC-type sulfate transport system substrate-binding protein